MSLREKGAAIVRYIPSCSQLMTRRGCEVPKFSVEFRQEVVQNLTGRNGSGEEIFKSHGTVRVTLTRPDPTREIPLLHSYFFSAEISQG